MDISRYINEFAQKDHRNKAYSKIYKNLLLEDKPYSLKSQAGYEESEYLPSNIKGCVQAYASNKDTAIELFKDFVAFLGEKGVKVPEIQFPPIPVSNTFERLMYIAKYLQDDRNPISELPDLLWISSRQVDTDLSRLRGIDDPIQVCGRKFYIPDTERRNGRINFQSTAHPVFLAENLTQILTMLKGLKAMSENLAYQPYAMETAKEIWEQLSYYAKNRICFVLKELMAEDTLWYESLSGSEGDNHFHTEERVSKIYNSGSNVIMDCLKNRKTFCMEYRAEDGVRFYKDCRIENISFQEGSFVVKCSGGKTELLLDRVIRSAYTPEELIAN